MPTNKYFNNDKRNFGNPEIGLYEDLIAEAIRINGIDCYFIPRESFNSEPDFLFGEDPASKFEKSYLMEMYVENFEGFGGDKDFFSRFGLEARNEVYFTISMRKFEQYVPTSVRTRPREGDLIFVPLMKRLFEVNFIDPNSGFYQIGDRRRYIYEMRTTQFRFSHEKINTGISEIDNVVPPVAYNIQLTLGAGTGDFHFGENVFTTTTSALVSEWIPLSKILTITRPVGEWLANTTVTGEESNAVYTISSVDDLDNFGNYNFSDNRNIQTAANTIIDTSEINPFGKP